MTQENTILILLSQSIQSIVGCKRSHCKMYGIEIVGRKRLSMIVNDVRANDRNYIDLLYLHILNDFWVQTFLMKSNCF